MRLLHIFIDPYDNIPIDTDEILSLDDKCIYCNLIVDFKIEYIFTKILESHDLNSDMNDYINDLEFCYKCVNKMHPCITEEEYNIKKLIE